MKTKRDFEIPQYCSLMYSLDDYEYIKVHFIIIENDERKYIFPIDEENLSDYENIKSCYFIFFPMNWYNRHNVRIKSNYSSSQWGLTTLNDEFVYELYKTNVIEQMLVAVLDENSNLMNFDDQEDKKKINFNLIDFAVERLIKLSIKKHTYNYDLDELSKNAYLYNRFHLLQNSGKAVGSIAPKPPAALILKNLSDKYPHRAPEELMFMDDAILEMFETLDTQEHIKQHEARTVNENVLATNKKRMMDNKGKGSVIPGWGVDKSSVHQSKPTDRKQLSKKLGAKLEDVRNFKKK